jgi:hypothetical protein
MQAARGGWHHIPTPSWDNLRIIGNSRIVKLTTIFPLVGYLIVFNEHVVSALHLEHSVLGGMTADQFLISRLRLLYFGLFFTGIGAAFFTLFCPPKIKQYADAVEFAQREIHFLPLPEFYSLVKELARLRSPAYEGIEIDDYRDRLATSEGDALEKLKVQVMTEWYWSQSRRRSVVRWSAFLFFLIGFSLLFYPSAATLWSVLLATF